MPRRPLGAVLALGTIAGICVLPFAGEAGTYTWTDERGVVHFSNSQVPAQHMARAEKRANITGPTPSARRYGSSRIPLISRDQKRFVSARLEGPSSTSEVIMLVDTGASVTMIDEATAQELGLEVVEQTQILGVGGLTQGWVGQVRRVQLGDKEVRDWRVVVGPVPGILLLGMDVLERLELTIASDHLESR